MSAVFQQLVAWQRQHGRRGLPWQQSADPYRVWLSEIMLQQTQVATVIGYYERFLAAFPDVEALAAAPVDAVLALWSGLGYYARARNLHRAAQQVVALGGFPRTSEGLQALPGVGPSTAHAIAAFSWGAPVAILDGNVKRWLVRWLALDADLSQKPVHEQLWQQAQALVPADASHAEMVAYTQACMDLGNLRCTRRQPRCDDCPLQSSCAAHAQGLQQQLPRPKVRKIQPERAVALWVCLWRDQVCLQQRPMQGLWGGLWCLPEYAGDEEIAVLAGAVPLQHLPAFTHVFTHFRLQISPCLSTWPETAPPPLDGRWFTLPDALQLGLPQPIRKILQATAAMQQDFRLQSEA